MSKEFEVILRAFNNNNQKFDLNIIDDIALKLDISAIESQEIGELFGISSQTFTIPGTDESNQFFNNLFDLGTTPAVSFGKTVACQVLADGQAIFTGKLYISDIVSDDSNNVIYNCVVTNETIDFRTQVDNLTLASLSGSFQKYNHSYNFANVTSSWENKLFSGSIFYPLVNYGSQVNDPSAPTIGFSPSGFISTGSMDNAATPLKISQFKPAIQIKTILDEIFASKNYKYTSSFVNTDYFKSLYYLSTPDENAGVKFVNIVSQSLLATPTVTQSFGFAPAVFNKINYGTEIVDAGNNYNTVNSSYTTKESGSYTFSSNLQYNVTASGAVLNATRSFVYQIRVNGVSKAQANISLGTSTTGVIPLTATVLNLKAGDVVEFYGRYTGRQSLDFLKVLTGVNSSWLKVAGAPTSENGTVNVASVFPPDLMVKDFLKGLSEKFNLIIEPVRGERNLLRIEPFNDWIDQGTVVDWTEIVDRSVKYKVTSPLINQARNLYFSDAIDEDVLNKNYFTTFGKIYGEYKKTTDLDLASGDKRIGEKFASTPTKFINNSAIVEVPWLCKEETSKALVPFKFKNRILHKQPFPQIVPQNEAKGTSGGSIGFYYILNNGVVQALNVYNTALPTYRDSVLDPAPKSVLHFDSATYRQFKSLPFKNYIPGAYDNYWAFYVNEIYDVNSRLLTCNIVLKPTEIPNIQLNDKIFIDGHYYRINKISGANLVSTDSVQVELLKTAPRKIPYNGRRRIITPRANEPNAYVDVIIDTYNDDGSITYADFETGEIITDQDIITQVAGIDGKDYYAGVTWDNEEYQVYNPNIISLGPNKYNETLTNVVNVGSGNTITDYTANSMVLGDNNIINAYIPAESGSQDYTTGIVLIANNTTINDSTNVVVIQPSGSRIISGSYNNVFVNPINDITATDDTGSVYTGNLVNQGTAKFKAGAQFTGSVDITGSLTLNGTAIGGINTGSFVTTSSFNSFTSSINAYTASNPAPALFNHAFATDPINETFLTITNPTGSNRAFTLKYNLTSGSVAINSGQLQVNTDGDNAASADIIVQRNLTGAPTASFSATFNNVVPPTLDIQASFIGTSYIMSGSYQSLI